PVCVAIVTALAGSTARSAPNIRHHRQVLFHELTFLIFRRQLKPAPIKNPGLHVKSVPPVCLFVEIARKGALDGKKFSLVPLKYLSPVTQEYLKCVFYSGRFQ